MLPFLAYPAVDPLLHERRRRQIAHAGVGGLVLEHGDVLEQIARALVSGRVAYPKHPLIVEAVEEAIGRRVIPAVALARH